MEGLFRDECIASSSGEKKKQTKKTSLNSFDWIKLIILIN